MLALMDTPRIRVKLRELLEREGVTVYRLHKEIGKNVNRTTLYNLVNRPDSVIQSDTVVYILTGLERITGKTYELRDLLEIIK